MKHKTLDRIEFKQTAGGEFTGEVSAVIATFNAIDHDGDVVQKTSFTDGQKVRLSAYNHASWGPGSLPVGRGEIRTTETEAQFHGKFFMATGAGRDTFEVVKEMGELQEYSWGYDILESEPGTVDGQDVQFLRKVDVHEVSPVLLGASIGTRTIGVKGKQMESDLCERLRVAGRERFGASDVYVYLEDFELDEGWAVFNVYSDANGDERHIRVAYLRGAGGDVALGPEEIEVEREVSYEPKAPVPADGFAALRARAAALTGAKAGELPEPEEDEGLRDYDARVMVAAVDKSIEAADDAASTKLSDRLTSVAADASAVTDEVARVVALRAEKGKELGDASGEAAAELRDALKRLSDLLCEQEDEGDDEPAEPWGEGLEIEDSLVRART